MFSSSLYVKYLNFRNFCYNISQKCHEPYSSKYSLNCLNHVLIIKLHTHHNHHYSHGIPIKMNITIWQEKRFWGIVHKHTRILTCRHTYMFLIVVELSWQMSSTAIINATRFLYVWKVSFVFLYYKYIVFNMMGKFLHNANLICLRTISTHDKQQWGVTSYKLSQFISSCFKSITSIMCYDHLNTYIFENIYYYQIEKSHLFIWFVQIKYFVIISKKMF